MKGLLVSIFALLLCIYILGISFIYIRYNPNIIWLKTNIYWVSLIISLFGDTIICRKGVGEIVKNQLLYLLTNKNKGVTAKFLDKTFMGISLFKDFLQNIVLLPFIMEFANFTKTPEELSKLLKGKLKILYSTLFIVDALRIDSNHIDFIARSFKQNFYHQQNIGKKDRIIMLQDKHICVFKLTSISHHKITFSSITTEMEPMNILASKKMDIMYNRLYVDYANLTFSHLATQSLKGN
ncbi:hypothetical protein MXB_2316 [Myxobolus squamalis]|nr:hypothetical protein MXB_2316 [Myxobolus squamalis]